MKLSRLNFAFIFMLVLVCWFAPKSFASDTATTNTAGTDVTSTPPDSYQWHDKLKRGSLNIVSSPVEVARSIQMTSSEESLLKGWTIGLLKGLGDGFVRLGAGVVDVLTCPFNFPDDNKGPLIQPEYVWQKPGPKYA